MPARPLILTPGPRRGPLLGAPLGRVAPFVRRRPLVWLPPRPAPLPVLLATPVRRADPATLFVQPRPRRLRGLLRDLPDTYPPHARSRKVIQPDLPANTPAGRRARVARLLQRAESLLDGRAWRRRLPRVPDPAELFALPPRRVARGGRGEVPADDRKGTHHRQRVLREPPPAPELEVGFGRRWGKLPAPPPPSLLRGWVRRGHSLLETDVSRPVPGAPPECPPPHSQPEGVVIEHPRPDHGASPQGHGRPEQADSPSLRPAPRCCP